MWSPVAVPQCLCCLCVWGCCGVTRKSISKDPQERMIYLGSKIKGAPDVPFLSILPWKIRAKTRVSVQRPCAILKHSPSPAPASLAGVPAASMAVLRLPGSKRKPVCGVCMACSGHWLRKENRQQHGASAGRRRGEGRERWEGEGSFCLLG